MLNNHIHNANKHILEYLEQLGFDTQRIDKKKKEEILTSFVHKSYASDFVPALDHNERLEFLGDGILGAAISFLLFSQHPERSEAQMTLYKIALVREEMLAHVAREIKLGEYIFISKGEEGQGGRDKDAILADTFEALLGALYQAYSFQEIVLFLEKKLFKHIIQLQKTNCKSNKSLLQERAQQQGSDIPEYITQEHKEGKANENFLAKVIVEGKILGQGLGRNKKKAHEAAAKQALSKIKKT